MRAALLVVLWIAISALGAFGIRRMAIVWTRRACLALWLLAPALVQAPNLLGDGAAIAWVLVLVASMLWWFGTLIGWLYKPNRQGELATISWGCGWRGIVLVVVPTALGLFVAFSALQESGAFSPQKCEENGGVWDHGIEVCKER